jgi:hypothetical protein
MITDSCVYFFMTVILVIIRKKGELTKKKGINPSINTLNHMVRHKVKNGITLKVVLKRTGHNMIQIPLTRVLPVEADNNII